MKKGFAIDSKNHRSEIVSIWNHSTEIIFQGQGFTKPFTGSLFYF